MCSGLELRNAGELREGHSIREKGSEKDGEKKDKSDKKRKEKHEKDKKKNKHKHKKDKKKVGSAKLLLRCESNEQSRAPQLCSILQAAFC